MKMQLATFKWLSAADRSYSDVVLAAGVVGIIALMILPLPALLIDALVAVNILIGVGLLLLAIYIPRPTAFSSFPSVLLLSTLFRLSLSIAITRMILLEGEGGHIIEAFGNMVVGGNLVVGLVVFVIITVVQFIVVAKGSERVAEVAARFTLDAMPGKQLSIDSDLRAGLIDKDDARRRRRMLELESQLHGSLDGAMKFVKGDAVAGIVIIIVNLLGGLAVGVLQRELPLSQAMHIYSILTIGDGLVAQIPALLCSISAGLVVTRTGGEGEDEHLGAVIGRQMSRQPRVIVIAGLLCLLLALVPGFPWPVFLALAALLLGSAAWRARHQLAPMRQLLKLPSPPAPDPNAASAALTAEPLELAPPPAMLLEMAPSLLTRLGREHVGALAADAVGVLREQFGVPLPLPVVRPRRDLGDDGYALSAFGVRLAIGMLPAERRFEAEALPPQADDAAPVEPAGVQWPPLPGQWRPASLAAPDALNAEALLERHLGLALRRQLGLFLGIQETSNLINRWSRDYPDLVKELLRVVPPQRVSEVLRRLVEEGVPVRNLRDVFEAIAEAGGREKDVVLLTEQVRMALRRQISDQFAGAGRRLQAVLAHPDLEDSLRQSARGSGAQAGQIAIDPELFTRLLGELRETRARLAGQWSATVLLSSMDVRRHLRRLIENEFFELPVLSFQELVGDIQVTPVGQVHG
jgi:type III secretion protein V